MATNITPPNDHFSCPLCGGFDSALINIADHRRYYVCQRCYLIYLDRSQLPLPEEEVERYRHHQNSLGDQGYVRFLEKAIVPVLANLRPDMKVLDYGCGPTPVLSQLLKRDYGNSCDYYDPFFYPELPMSQYDLIFSTETFEHFFRPADELNRLYAKLNTGGFLCIMTLRWRNLEEFEHWWYRRDQTHVCFYHQHTFSFISKKWPSEICYDDQKQVIVIQKR